jgi:hypothetical protein
VPINGYPDVIQRWNTVKRAEVPDQNVDNFKKLAATAPNSASQCKGWNENSSRKQCKQANKVASQAEAKDCTRRNRNSQYESSQSLRRDLPPDRRWGRESDLLNIISNFAVAD